MSFEESLKEYEEIGIESPFDQCEDTEEIAYKMNEIVEDELLADEEFQKNHGVNWAIMRLDYLSLEQTDENWMKLQELYWDKTLIDHLKETQVRAENFIKTEKPRMMKAWKIESEDSPQYPVMMSALREMLIKEIIEE
ncbi:MULTISPECIES: hypothetical protein [Fenollaria]|uniref:hypothetical protein n=1 Tax=Fenollaria TaxID=1686313 RepID=UPI0003719621|nr:MULTISPECIES: hypothetical protein [Fenollaria]